MFVGTGLSARVAAFRGRILVGWPVARTPNVRGATLIVSQFDSEVLT